MNIDDEKQLAEYNEYLRDCDKCATVPTVSGAFQWAWRSCENNKIKKLESALRPFADHPAFHAPDNWAVTYLDYAHEVPGVTAGDFQRAKTAMTANVELRGGPLLDCPARMQGCAGFEWGYRCALKK